MIEELRIPESVDAADAADFATVIDLANTFEAQAYGTEELRHTAAEDLPWWQLADHPHRLFGVRVDGALAGFGVYEYMATDPDGCQLSVGVLPAFRRRGIGTAIAEHLERVALADGRRKLIAYAASPDAPGDRLPSPTGFGSVPAGNPEVRFLRSRGFRLEQVERLSRLALPAQIATVEPPSDYRLHFWVGRTPPEWLDQLAVLYTRMSTDAPSAGIEEPEDVMTAERVVEVDDAYAASGRSAVFAAVEHVPTGVLAGYTNLAAATDTNRAVNQYATLVLREHRGHGLGMLLKVANIEHLQRVKPGHPAIVTFNAEENRFMLDVNEAVGFAVVGYEGAWRKDA